MSDSPCQTDPITESWMPQSIGPRAGLRILVLTDRVETTVRVSDEGPVSLSKVHSWIDAHAAIAAEDYEVLVLETSQESWVDGVEFASARRSATDLHIALVGREIDPALARAALRHGATGVILSALDYDTFDTPLRMVAEGKVYIDSSLACHLLGEAGPVGSVDQPLISLTDTVALVADDDEYFRMALVTILTEKFGFTEVHEASNLEQARQMITGCNRVDLALFDLRMPGMKGASALKDIRLAHPEIRKMAVVSGSQDRNDVLEALSAGTYGFVSKAEGVSELKLALTQILSGRIYAPALLHEAPGAGMAPQSIRGDTALNPRGFEPHAAAPHGFDPAPDAVVLSFESGAQVEFDIDPEDVAEAARYVPEPVADPAPDPAEIPELSPRQRRVLELLVQGMSNKEIAREMNLGIGTVKVHMTALFSKLGVSNRTSAVAVGAPLL